ncbi:unnamed protein product [Linum trigynum]|uniref:Leucine-rich repeat-containing N-terminal plant-type domain-containing protein n=1 Tax=Linum trigynum TaxID=586398 RepID=A0AAV2GVQ0_9ROSI
MRRLSTRVADDSRCSMRFLMALALAAVTVMTAEWQSCVGNCLEQERLALLDIHAFFGDAALYSQSSGDCCGWRGVTCNHTTGRVIELGFYGAEYGRLRTGGRYLNASLFLPFQELRLLSLFDFPFCGCMENEGFDKLSKLANLKVLMLYANEFSNDILPSLGKLSQLEGLHLSGNSLKGMVDVDELNELSGLRRLSLRDNNIQGFVSYHGDESMLRLSHLEELDLSDNNFKNDILSSLSRLSSLEHLNLDSNRLNGMVDIDELNKLGGLKELFLGDNEIQGFASFHGNETVLRLPHLEWLELSNTSISSTAMIFSAFKQLYSLQYLSLADNNLFEGSVDMKELAALTKLQELELSGNLVVEDLAALMNLESLTLGDTTPLQRLGRFDFQGSSKLEKLNTLWILTSIIEVNFFRSIGTLMTNLTYLKIFNSPSLVNSTIPQDFCNLKHLQEIQLSGNGLVGELPQCFSKLTSLQRLDIYYNQLSGDLSQSPLTTIFSLQTIDISQNLFLIPFSLSPFFNHSRLKIFYGSSNQEIYEDEHRDYVKQQGTFLLHQPLFQLTDLKLGSSQRNDNIDGVFPKFLYHQHDLEHVDISNIKLKGVGFPSWMLVNNTNLAYLTLSNCSLSGSFPLTVQNWSRLSFLDASNNDISGKIPRWIWNLPVLQILDLSKNNLSGSLPSGFITSRMSEVYLSRNQLKGTLTKGDHGNLSSHNEYPIYSLSVLDLSHNHLSGTIPKWISILPRLSYLLLNNNEFYGEIPIPFTLEQVKLIVISHNHFFGQLASVLTSNISTISYNGYITKDLELVTKTNLYTYKGKPLDSLSGFDFSNNNFSGEIPPQISYKDDMKFLNLSNNQLKGSIPPSFSRLLQIESLDLSHNNLSGTIPSELAALTFLGSFSVAYNNLSGKCPKVAQFATFNDSSYQGNPYLRCTFPLPPSGPLLTPPASYDGDDDYGGSFIDMESFYASSGVSFVMVLLTIASVLYINPYWRGVWFYYVRVTITSCYYFVVDHLPVPVK